MGKKRTRANSKKTKPLKLPSLKATGSRPEQQQYLLVDSHLDIAFNAVTLGRDFLQSALAERVSKPSKSSPWGFPTVGFPEMRTANIRIAFASIWAAACDNPTGIPVEPCYKTPEEAYEQGQKQLAYYERLATRSRVKLVTSRKSLQTVTWHDYRLGLVLSMEGADPILSPENLHEWVIRGLRVIGLAHGRTRYSGGTRQPGQLTELGRNLLSAMEREHIILDTSHMSEASFFEALDAFHGPVIATHSNCRALIPTDRHLSDDMIRAIVKRDGIIGVVLYNEFLNPDWRISGRVKEHVTLAHVVRQVKHLCEVAGESRHIGIGSDFDGGFGSESIPAELDTIADLPKVGVALAKAGFSQSEVSGILGRNWVRFLAGALPA